MLAVNVCRKLVREECNKCDFVQVAVVKLTMNAPSGGVVQVAFNAFYKLEVAQFRRPNFWRPSTPET